MTAIRFKKLCVAAVAVLVLMLSSCSKDADAAQLSLFSTQELVLKPGESHWSYCAAQGLSATEAENLIFASSDESVAELVFDSYDKHSGRVYFFVNALAEGEAQVWLQTADGRTESEVLPVKVSLESTSATVCEPTSLAAKTVVFRTPSGKRYHLNEACGGKNSYVVLIEDALNDGLTPCQKCVK